MGKKGKRNSKKEKKEKSKKGKKSVTKVPKVPQIDIELIKDLSKDLQDVFRFWNGDVYIGHFTLTAEGGILMEGSGKYFTADGCVFSGRWENDVLVEAEKMSYPDGSWYKGPLENGGYTGLGSYSIPQLGTLECKFVQRRPLGMVALSDIDNNKWQGQAAHGSLTLVPRNHFFDSEDAILRAMASSQIGSIASQSSQPKSLNVSEKSHL